MPLTVRAIRTGDPPGRFLKKDEKTGKWFDIGDKKAGKSITGEAPAIVSSRFSRVTFFRTAEKTSQALREKQEDEQPTTVNPGSLGMLLPNPAGYLAGTAATVMGNLLAASAPDLARGAISAPTSPQVPGPPENGNAAMESFVNPAAAHTLDTAGHGENVDVVTESEGSIPVEEAQV